MRLAVMQPYLFPYLGYFQLLASVDKFVLYDDVNFIKQGWINRNNILLEGKPFMFTVPLQKISSFTLIKDTKISRSQPWAPKILRTLEQAYRKAPYFGPVSELIADVLFTETELIGELAAKSIQAVNNYLGIQTKIVLHSDVYNNQQLSAQERVIDICRQEGATAYHNSIGGQELYSKKDFAHQGIELAFVASPLESYIQLKDPFVPWLSIIDVLMFSEPKKILKMSANYEVA